MPMSHVHEEIDVDRAVHMNCLDDAGSAVRVHLGIKSSLQSEDEAQLGGILDGRRSVRWWTRVKGDQQEMKLKRGALTNAASMFGVTRATVSRIWKLAVESRADGSVCIDVMACKRGRSGRKKKEIDSDRIPLVNGKIVRALGAGMDLSASTIHRAIHGAIKNGRINLHSNLIKPFLTNENQIKCL